MSSKVKLWLNLVAIVVVFSLITITVGALLTKEVYFLSPPGTRPEAHNLSLDIKGKVNGADFFTISFENGQKSQDVSTINPEDMNFTADRTEISFDMTFENLSDSVLYIEISGIYLDTLKYPNNPRFSTSLYINNVQRLITQQENGTGLYTLELALPQNEDSTPNIDDGSLMQVSLKYNLLTFNRNINNEKQDLLITISRERLDV